MSGKYAGMKKILKDKNNLVEYSPCAGHSLNLVGQSAVHCCVEAVSFFQFMQRLYSFFVASTHRWNILIHMLRKIRNALSQNTHQILGGLPGLMRQKQSSGATDNSNVLCKSLLKIMTRMVSRRTKLANLQVIWPPLRLYLCMNSGMTFYIVSIATVNCYRV